jgi:hypothetical protein
MKFTWISFRLGRSFFRGNFYRCTAHFEIYVVHSPTNALFISLVKFTLKYTIISLLHVSVFNDHHQEVLSVPNQSYTYVKTFGKITSFYKLGDVAAFRGAACLLCAVQSETHSALHTTGRNM